MSTLLKPILIRLPHDLEIWLKEEAMREDRSFNSMVRHILNTQRQQQSPYPSRISTQKDDDHAPQPTA